MIFPVAMRADIRFWTAIAMIGICGFSVAQGWSIVHFSLATAKIDSSEKRAEIVNPWTAVPGVASAALQAELKEKFNPSDLKAANSRREALCPQSFRSSHCLRGTGCRYPVCS